MTPAEPEALLATKLEVPPPRPGLVRRPRLLERLAPAAGGATLVCAPARLTWESSPCWATRAPS